MRDEGDRNTSGKWRKAIQQNKVIAILIVCISVAVIVGLILIFALSELFVEKERNFRLPASLVPTHYSLEIKPYLIPGDFRFEGNVEIKIKCKHDTDEIVLHSRGLEVKEESVTVQNAKGGHLNVLRIKRDKGNQFLILQLLEELKENETYHASISFQGTMKDDGTGLFVSSYVDSNGVTHYTASTRFELFNARAAFPCFDEPALKANFDIIMVRWKNMTSLSNMNRVKIEPRGGDWVADFFQTTPKMSTYLVAFFVGDYEGRTKDKITIWSTPDGAKHTDVVLETSSKLLKFYEDLLPRHELPKLDMVFVTDLTPMEIEHWGWIISYQSFLLDDENDTDNSIMRERAPLTIAHEIAHQWFGNLVTPKWWSDIWLSEGIATYMEQIASKALFPQRYQIDKTIKEIYHGLIQQDCDKYITPHRTVNKETSDSKVFDWFRDTKGAIIIRMAHEILGDNIFRKGLSNYLEKYSYGVAEEKDLWECLTKAQYTDDTLKVNMTERMTPWTHLPGLPIVNVTRDYDRKTATFYQKSCHQGYRDNLWPVPITYTTSVQRQWNPKISMWLTSRNATIEDMPNEKQWILVNGKSTGYFVVNYDQTNWNLLAEELREHPERFPLEHRFKILSDANALERMGHLRIDTLLDLTLFLAKETKLSILTAHNMLFIRTTWILVEQNYYIEDWKEYMLYILEPAYKLLHREDVNVDVAAPIETSLFISSVLCTVNYAPCVNEDIKEFQDWKRRVEDGTENLQNGRSPFHEYKRFCFAIKYGNISDWEFIYDIYLKSGNPKFLEPLACSTNTTLTKRLLKVIFEENQGTGHHALWVLSISTNWIEILIYFDDHFDEIANNDFLFEKMLSILHPFRGPTKIKQVLATCRKFLHRLSGAKAKELKEILDEKEELLPELEKQRDTVQSWLERKPWLTKE